MNPFKTKVVYVDPLSGLPAGVLALIHTKLDLSSRLKLARTNKARASSIHEVTWLKLLQVEKEDYELFESGHEGGWAGAKAKLQIIRNHTNAINTFFASIQNKDIHLFKVKKFWSTLSAKIKSKSSLHKLMSTIALKDTSATFTLALKRDLYNLCVEIMENIQHICAIWLPRLENAKKEGYAD